MKILEVVAAVIFNKKGEVLICQRKVGKSLGGKWEFPGGKVKDCETHQQALERELMEELNIKTRTKESIAINHHEYPTFSIELYAYRSEYISGNIELTDHDKFAWVTINELRDFDLADADIPVVKQLLFSFKKV